jgi:hypothetical protein
MTGTIRILLLVEAATFVVASLIHSGWLVAGYQHHQARIAEGVIAVVLLAAVVVSWIHPAWTRRSGLAGQAFALLGTLVGVFTIVVGVGPRTMPDVVYHVGIIVLLALGLRATARWRAGEPS